MKKIINSILILLVFNCKLFAIENRNYFLLKDVIRNYTSYNLDYYLYKFSLSDTIYLSKQDLDSSDIRIEETFFCNNYTLEVEKYLTTGSIKFVFFIRDKSCITFEIAPIIKGFSIIIENDSIIDISNQDSIGYSYFYCNKNVCIPCNFIELDINRNLTYSNSYLYYKCISNNLDSLMKIYQLVNFFWNYKFLPQSNGIYYGNKSKGIFNDYENGTIFENKKYIYKYNR